MDIHLEAINLFLVKIDLVKMPLGKISNKNIKEAFEILKQLSKVNDVKELNLSDFFVHLKDNQSERLIFRIREYNYRKTRKHAPGLSKSKIFFWKHDPLQSKI